MTTRLESAIRGLGKYFNVIDKTSFISMLVADVEGEEDSGSEDTMTVPPEVEVAKLFLDLTEGGLLTTQLIERMKEVFEGASDDEKNELIKTLYIVYEGADSNGVDFESDKMPVIPVDAPWLENRSEGAGSMFNIVGLADVGEGVVINTAPASPSKTAPAISVYCVLPVQLNIANRDTGAVALFMTSIPTIELSRCVPYIDITLVTPKAPLSSDGRIQTISLSQFLLGQATVEEATADYAIASAVSTEVLQEFEEQQTAEEEEEAASEAMPSISSAGMELFCSPQTLVPADEDFHDFEAYQTITTSTANDDGTETESEESVGATRGAGIIDKFRPFLTLKGLSINVAPSTGMMSYKTAKMGLTLHDRSRLSEVAAFVKPDLYGSTELLIEYGWSHPDGGPESENDFGVLLDSMRVKEKYTIVNSSFKFDEVGQVEIDVSLAMKGSAAVDTTSISKGAGVEDALEAVGQLTEAIAILRSKIMGDSGGSSDVSGSTVISAASDTSRATSIDDETKQKIVDYISDNRNADADSDIGQLRDNLTSLYGTDGQSGAVSDLQDTIAAAVATKTATLSGTSATADPWLPYIYSAAGFVNVEPDDTPVKFVSLAKLFAVFAGTPLAATGRFDEVQFIYYAFNCQASYVKDLNIAEFPIKIEDFEKQFKEKTKTSANIPIKAFLNFISSNFLKDQGSYAWGLADLYEADDEGNMKMKEEYEDATALYSQKQMRLADAYNVADSGGSSLDFKKPKLQMYIETVRVNDSEVSGDTGSATGGAAQTILRIHIFDKQTTAYESLGAMLGAARSDQMGTLGKAASEVKSEASDEDPTTNTALHQQAFAEQIQSAIDGGLIEALPSIAGASAGSVSIEDFAETKFRIKGGFSALKKFISDTMPTIIYGSQNSAIIKASLASMNNPKLASVNMMRGGMGAGTTAQGARDSGVPMSVSPTQLSMDIFGCPLVNFGQQFFVDFNTGTTVDNIYAVTGVDHKIESGKFETSLKLVQLDAFGKYTSMIGNVEGALAMIAESEDDEEA